MSAPKEFSADWWQQLAEGSARKSHSLEPIAFSAGYLSSVCERLMKAVSEKDNPEIYEMYRAFYNFVNQGDN